MTLGRRWEIRTAAEDRAQVQMAPAAVRQLTIPATHAATSPGRSKEEECRGAEERSGLPHPFSTGGGSEEEGVAPCRARQGVPASSRSLTASPAKAARGGVGDSARADSHYLYPLRRPFASTVHLLDWDLSDLDSDLSEQYSRLASSIVTRAPRDKTRMAQMG